MNSEITIVWLRNDLRLEDNPALYYANEYAKKNNSQISIIYIYENFNCLSTDLGSASKWWLNNSLKKFNENFSKDLIQKNDFNINLFKGDPEKIFSNLIKKFKINGVFWNRRYEAKCVERDTKIKSKFKTLNINVQTYNGKVLVEPWNIKGKQNQNLKVFTPYKNSLLGNHFIPESLPVSKIKYHFKISSSLKLSELNLISNNWMKKFDGVWHVGEKAALIKLEKFISNSIDDYDQDRNFPFKDGTSKLSPHLHFGEISPVKIWNMTCNNQNYEKISNSRKVFLSEIIWREFAVNLMFLYPNLDKKNIKKNFNNFKWNDDQENFKAWTKGNTGYPIVDAAMKELWDTGWMHNRARMITASFLTKHLLIPWRWGANWFHDTLLDADFASNYASWQWVAGCGADAAPYFRIFNPLTQSSKFDPSGKYIKKYIPELKNLDSKEIHSPSKSSYKSMIVDHKFARERALNTYSLLRKFNS
tara:strand:+ start:136 stop:1560 length:1425 start_codon:yes stop_codon:yes gene_type:complete